MCTMLPWTLEGMTPSRRTFAVTATFRLDRPGRRPGGGLSHLGPGNSPLRLLPS